MNNPSPSVRLAGIETPRVGLGCMGMSEFYGPADDEASLTALRRAHAMGYRHFDIADMYGGGSNERLLGRFLRELGAGERTAVLVATKVGIERTASGGISANSTPDYIRRACEASLSRLGVERISLLYLHRRNVEVPIQESIGAMLELVKAGKVGYIGLSEVSSDTLSRACRAGPIEALQSEYSLWTRDVEASVMATCKAHGVSLVAYSPLGRGFLTGKLSKESLDEKDLRRRLPRFQADNFNSNQSLLEELKSVAQELGCAPAQAALAWVLGRWEQVHVIPGSRREANIASNLASIGVELPAQHWQRLEAAFSAEVIHGQRYPDALLKTVNV